MFGAMSISHWLIAIAVLTLLFGRNKISGLMGDVAKGFKELRKINDDDDSKNLPVSRREP